MSDARAKTCNGPTRSRISVPGPATNTIRRVARGRDTLLLLRRRFISRWRLRSIAATWSLVTCHSSLAYEFVRRGFERFLVVIRTEIVGRAFVDRLWRDLWIDV